MPKSTNKTPRIEPKVSEQHMSKFSQEMLKIHQAPLLGSKQSVFPSLFKSHGGSGDTSLAIDDHDKDNLNDSVPESTKK